MNPSTPESCDILIINGLIIDGTGKEPYHGNIGIRGKRISCIGSQQPQAKKIIDAAGKIVCPGFIDVHCHGEIELLAEPECPNKVMDGVTTIVVGNCGLSPFPFSRKMNEQGRLRAERFGVTRDWHTYEDYCRRLTDTGVSVNVAILAGHGTIRRYCAGDSARAPSPMQMQAMKRELRYALERGAFGLSTGLIYPPGCFASTDEISELARLLSDFDSIYASHIRGEGETLERAIEEFFAIAQDAPRSQLSHIKVHGRTNWYKIHWLIETLQQNRHEINFRADRYPYTASMTGLSSFLPNSTHNGGKEMMLSRVRERRDELLSTLSSVDWDSVVVSFCDGSYEGLSVSQVAQVMQCTPEECALKLIELSDGEAQIIYHSMSEENLRLIYEQDFVMAGSDASPRSITGPTAKGKPHPRAFGTFARFLRLTVTEWRIVSIEESIRRLTSAPAEHFRIRSRGALKPAYFADILILDPRKFLDTATFDSPASYTRGLQWMLVNGESVVREGSHTGARSGRVLQRDCDS